MEAPFLDLVEGLHRWCVSGQVPTLPALLSQAQVWLVPQLQPAPATTAAWLVLWRTPLGGWWPTALPAEWETEWRLLSRQETTLTPEALSYLETQRPGVMAAALPVPSPPTPLPATALPERVETPEAPAHWNLADLVTCVIREIRRREQVYPELVHQQRMTPAQAEQELHQMRAVQTYLLANLRQGTPPQQQDLF